MRNIIYKAFHDIKAEDKLKQDTLIFLQKKINRKSNNSKRITVALASVFIIFFASGLSYNLYYTESAYVDIDVNPSIEMTLNRFNRVIGVYSYNQDGGKVISAVKLKYKLYDEALAILIDEMVTKGYLTNEVLFSASIQTKDYKNENVMLSTLKTHIETLLQLHHNILEQNIFTVDSKTKKHAYELNLSPAKYLAIMELQAVDPNATFENCQDHTISEIKKQTHNHMNGEHNGDDYHGFSEKHSPHRKHHNTN